MEHLLVIHTGGQPYVSGHFLPRRPRDIGQFRPAHADPRTFQQLQGELQWLEQLAAEEAALAAIAPRKAGFERPDGQRPFAPPAACVGSAVDASSRLSGAGVTSAPPARQAPGRPGGGPRHAQLADVARRPVSRPKSEPGPDDVAVQCEDCGAAHVLRAVRNRPLPAPPAGNWFCARCTKEAHKRGIKLFDRVVRTRQVMAGARKLTQYLVRYWGHDDDDDEWLSHEDMQRLEVSCKGT